MQSSSINSQLVDITITLSNEYVCSNNKHKISGTNGQAKIKFSEKQFQEIFGQELTGYIYFSLHNLKNFVESLRARWTTILKGNHDFKNPNIEIISTIIGTFYEKYSNMILFENDIIEEKYSMTMYKTKNKKDRYALTLPLFTKIIYYIAIPFETFIEIKKTHDNHIFVSFGLNFTLIKNSILYKQQNESKDNLNNKYLTKARKGQDKLRQILLKKYNKCQITELEYNELLIASHIKPWVFSETKEKEDINNALLLSATFDKLFDRGLITFNISGHIVFSDLLPSNDIYKLKKIIKNRKLEFNKEQMKYLKYHREKVFRCINGSLTLS